MTSGWQLFSATWQWEPSIVLGCLALLVGYAALLRFRLNHRAILFATGVLILFLSLTSPLDLIGERYLFSLHMLQHLLLLQVVPPLLLLGTPPELVERALRLPLLRRVEWALRQAPVAWILGLGTIWVWHIPALYNEALINLPVHIAQHIIFLVSATIFWWPVFTPQRERRLSLGSAAPYLFFAAAGSTLLGIILTFARPGIYPAYLKPFDTLGALPLIREQWGLTPAVDQQFGGLIMWVPGSLVYLGCILTAFARWIQEPGDDTPLVELGKA